MFTMYSGFVTQSQRRYILKGNEGTLSYANIVENTHVTNVSIL